MGQTKTGHCMCGAVQFTARNVPHKFGSCYCDMCMRWTGSRYMGVHIAQDDLDVSGAAAIATIQSSDWAERAFCKQCGSGLWYKLTGAHMDGRVSLAVGLLDDTTDMTLAIEYFVDRKTCAYAFPEDRIQMTEAEVRTLFAASEEGEPQ